MLKKLVGLMFFVSAVSHAQYVEIIRIDPIYSVVNQQQCSEVIYRSEQRNPNPVGGVVGAITGAAIGNQIGGGSGKDISTVVGGVVGYQIGANISTNGVHRRTECYTVPVRTQVGETVTFRYNGRIFSQTFR